MCQYVLTVEIQIRGYKYNREVLQIFFVDIFQNEMMASLQKLGQFLLNKLCISKLLLHFCSRRSEIQIKTTFQYNHLYLKSSFSMIYRLSARLAPSLAGTRYYIVE